MPATTNKLDEALSSFCKITYTTKKQVTELTGREDSEALLEEGWKRSFVDESYHVKSGAITFPIHIPSGEESAWIEVTLKRSHKEGEKLPYFTLRADLHEGAPREYDRLESFAFVKGDLYNQLESMALAEPWSFSGEGNDLLKFYLNGTFLRLLDEGKIAYAKDGEGDMCVWCTGLVDAHYEDIFCFCTPNDHPGAKQQWVVRSFCTSGSTHFGQRLRRAFGTKPPLRANYFGDLSEIIFDGNMELVVDYGHILQRVHRIAIPALKKLLSSSSKAMAIVSRAEGVEPQNREAVLTELNAVVAEDAALQRTLHDAIALASERARARARYMYSSALPAWNPRAGVDVAFCLPLCLIVEERVDTVLVAGLAKGAKEPFYEGKTLFDIQMAYRTARIVQRTDGMTGWVSTAFAADDDGQASFAFATPSAALTPTFSKSPKIATPVSDEGLGGTPLPARAKLVPEGEGLSALMVCDGDTIGLLRRQYGDIPRIQLPAVEGFGGVGQIQGRFSHDGERWSFIHEGRNWTEVTKLGGTSIILEEVGSSVELGFGDLISFTGSPAYRLER